MDLVLRENNLYRNGILVDTGDGDFLLLREPLDLQGTVDDKYHTVTTTDRIDLLAFKYYRNKVKDPSKYWWMIADANVEIQEPLDLSALVGKKILIPDVLKTLLLI